MRSIALLGGLLAACSFQAGKQGQVTPDGTVVVDGPAKLDAPAPHDGPQPIDGAHPIDAFVPDAAPSQFCAGSAGLLPGLCEPKGAGSAVVLGPGTIDTGTDGRCQLVGINGSALCVIDANGFTITGMLRVIGPRPLVLFSSGDIHVGSGATIDVSSTGSGSAAGAGALTNCTFSGTPGNAGNAGQGGGGGAGGTFGSRGANGAVGGGGVQEGLAATAPIPLALRGGCNGQDGGFYENSGVATGMPGKGGVGGGAIYLYSETSIRLDGGAALFASGAGGQGGQTMNTGGGGGGAGGLIGLEAPTVALALPSSNPLMPGAIMAANGGGGGGGAGFNGNATQMIGAPGGPGTTMMWNMAAPGGMPGGNGSGTAGAGSPGAAINMQANQPGNAPAGGGGGGGGGLGYIAVYATTFTGGESSSPSEMR